MVRIDSETGDIAMSKGDTVTLNVAIRINNSPYTLQTGDRIILSIRIKEINTVNDYPNVVLEESNSGQSNVNFKLTAENMKDCDCGSYLYDIKIIHADGDRYALTLPLNFEILETVGDMI